MFRKAVLATVVVLLSQVDIQAQYHIAKDQLGYEMQNYYKHPSYSLLRALILSFEDDARKSMGKTNQWPLFGFLTAAISKQSSPEIFLHLADSVEFTKPLVLSAVAMSGNSDTIAKWGTHAPGVNDMLWGAFFATGDTLYLSRLISEMIYCDEQNDIMLYVIGATAKWSLCSNAQSYPEVEIFLKELVKREHDPMRPHILECLESTPKQLNDKMVNDATRFKKK